MSYCDNAATTFPKPQPVYDAVSDFMKNIGASPGRSTHSLGIKASAVLFETRELCARLFNIGDSARIVFTANATEALNTALLGILKRGDRVVVSAMEHNSVMRPLRFLKENAGIEILKVPCDRLGMIDVDAFERTVKTGVRCAVINHASNVCGTIQPIDKLGAVAWDNRTIFIVDAAQTAGALPIDVKEMSVDVLAFSGHKSLYGPQGTGGLFIKDGIVVRPLKFGGTGSRSESDEQPDFLPDHYESGTLNGPGIAGLGAGISFVMHQGPAIRYHGMQLLKRFFEGLKPMEGNISIHGPCEPEAMLPTISISVNGMDNGIVARRLNDDFGICCRMGLHCAPSAHRTLGTFPQGTLRLSFGFFNTDVEIENVVRALKTISCP
jgi:cysteine desulfurase family protein